MLFILVMKFITALLVILCGFCFCNVELGVDRFFNDGYHNQIKEKRAGIITNHTGVDANLTLTLDRLLEEKVKLSVIFSPEHGLTGSRHAAEKGDSKTSKGLPLYSLHGATRRPTKKMLSGVDVLIYDIQDIGSRTYTYATTLYYVMEEAAKHKKPLIVFDRPNPLGNIVDGPMLDPKWRSFIGYINVPYCHGMTIGELATFFNEEYKIKCDLTVVKMRGYKRTMTFKETGLTWVPTSPHIPEADTPLFYASTGILGELDLVNIGVGYTLPFKVVGAPWINAQEFANALNAQKLSGVHFAPFHYKPFYGSYKGKECQGVLIVVTDPPAYRPLTTQYLMLGIIKSLYPKQLEAALTRVSSQKQDLFCKANGNEKMFHILKTEKYVGWTLVEFEKKEREEFLKLREKYLFPEYH